MQALTDLEHFLDHIEKGAFEQAKDILLQNNKYIDPSYVDKEGNTLFHYVVRSVCEKVSELKNSTTLKEILEQEQYCIEFHGLVKTMLQYEFLWGRENNEKLTPRQIMFTYHQDPNSVFLLLVRVFTKEIEKKGRLLLPGRRYVYDLHLYRASKKPFKVCNIPDKWLILDQKDKLELTLHQRLAYYDVLLRQSKDNANYISNLVVANVGFVISDKSRDDPLHKPIFVTLPIMSDYLIHPKLNGSKSSHSESGLCCYLLNPENLKRLANELKQMGYSDKNHKIYAVVLDIHSTLMVCPGCGSELQELATEKVKEGFVETLKAVFQDPGLENSFIFPKRRDLQVILRADGMHLSSGDRKKTDLNPNNIVHAEYNRNTKAHSTGSFFHLIPKQNKEAYGGFLSQEDHAFIDESEVKAAEKIDFFKGKSVASYKQTAFPNTGGNDHVRGNTETLSNSQVACDFAIERALKI